MPIIITCSVCGKTESFMSLNSARTQQWISFKKNQWKCPECRNIRLRMITVFLPEGILNFIQKTLVRDLKLFPNKSEAIRYYLIKMIFEDLDKIKQFTETKVLPDIKIKNYLKSLEESNENANI